MEFLHEQWVLQCGDVNGEAAAEGCGLAMFSGLHRHGGMWIRKGTYRSMHMSNNTRKRVRIPTVPVNLRSFVVQGPGH